jgi:hypothetical protein
MRQEVMQASGARALALGLRAGAVLLAEEGAVVVGPAHEDAPEETVKGEVNNSGFWEEK